MMVQTQLVIDRSGPEVSLRHFCYALVPGSGDAASQLGHGSPIDAAHFVRHAATKLENGVFLGVRTGNRPNAAERVLQRKSVPQNPRHAAVTPAPRAAPHEKTRVGSPVR